MNRGLRKAISTMEMVNDQAFGREMFIRMPVRRQKKYFSTKSLQINGDAGVRC